MTSSEKSAAKQEIIAEFKRGYIDRYDTVYIPTGADRGCASNLLNWYGRELSILIIMKFWDCIDNVHTYANCRPTLTALVWNRADLVKRIFEDSNKTSEEHSF